MKNVIFKIELEIANARNKITALEEDIQFETEEAIRLAKLGDTKAIPWKSKKIELRANDLDKMDHYVRGLRTALRIAKNDN